MSLVRSTPDAYLGLDNPTAAEWSAWHRAMLEERAAELARAGLDTAGYRDRATDWSDTAFRQLFLFMYDASFYDRDLARYRTSELVDRWTTMFGRIDSVLLWHAYPRLGFDTRTQFDFYRDMPGGLEALRAQVSDVFHARGIRVFVDYNPWAEGGYEELGEIVAALDADGVMLDTMTDAPDLLAREVLARRRGVVFAPELRARIEDLGRLRQSWAQWSEIGDAETPSIPKHRWLVPRHRQHTIARWDESRKGDIVYSFWSGSGLLLWDNVFGSWNPYSREDRRLIAETAAIFDLYEALFVHGDWLPLIPTGRTGLDANCWTLASRSIVTLRNRTEARIEYRVPESAPNGLARMAFWRDGDGVRRVLRAGDMVGVAPGGIQALVLDDPQSLARAVSHFDELSRRADVAMPGYDERTPTPRRLASQESLPRRALPLEAATRMVEMPAGVFVMRLRHERRECGCYPFGATDALMWGWFYKDMVEHVFEVSLAPYAIRASAVTNAEFLAFVHDAGYRPRDAERFLQHVARGPDGSLPLTLPPHEGLLPVTFVSLDDARSYAAWHGQRLPTEAEWQWAAEGAGRALTYPWGNEPPRMTAPARLTPAREPSAATPQGVLGLSGNAWELTESEHSDGHTRFAMLRGGVFLPPGTSEWLVARGARPNDSHVKYILLSDGLDRSETISFRTVS